MGEMGFEELQHAADWAVRVWAPTMESLFVESAKAMYALSGIKKSTGGRVIQTANGWGPDMESLLVSFLSELIFRFERDRLAFDAMRIRLTPEAGGHKYEARLDGQPSILMNKAIKAVTYHNLKILRTGDGYEVEIVFDV